MEPELLLHWKKQYGEYYTIEIGNVLYYYRALTLQEIDDITAIINLSGKSSVELEDYYVQNALLHPQIDLSRIKAGYISQLAEAIMYVSGLSDIEYTIKALEKERVDIVTDIIAMMKVFVVAAMPLYTDENLNEFTMKQLIQKVVFAEKIFGLSQAVNGLESNTIEFQLRSVNEEETRKPVEKVDKKTLLKRIKQQQEVHGAAMAAAEKAALDKLDDELLLRASGMPRPDDPIARKLKESMGG